MYISCYENFVLRHFDYTELTFEGHKFLQLVHILLGLLNFILPLCNSVSFDYLKALAPHKSHLYSPIISVTPNLLFCWVSLYEWCLSAPWRHSRRPIVKIIKYQNRNSDKIKLYHQHAAVSFVQKPAGVKKLFNRFQTVCCAQSNKN